MTETARWWGDHDIAVGETVRFEIGALELDVRREAAEWKLAWRRGPDPLQNRAAIYPVDDMLVPDKPGFERRVPQSAELETFHLTPVMADRAIIVQAESRVVVPAHSTTTILVTCPLWARLDIGGGKFLLEIPTCRPSDTWFGPNTMAGELCYAGRTWAKTSEAALGRWHNRAIVQVEVENAAEDSMEIDGIRIPATNLAVFASPDDRLWTPRVKMQREASGHIGSLRLLRGAPSAQLEQVAEERQVLSGRSIRRGLHRLFR